MRVELYDFRQQRGIGSDMVVTIDELRKWVELKSYAGDAPSSVTLTLNEFLRARDEGADFYLAVVSGLAEGYETVVRLYRNPVARMPWAPPGLVSFGGLTKVERLECRLVHGTDPGGTA